MTFCWSFRIRIFSLNSQKFISRNAKVHRFSKKRLFVPKIVFLNQISSFWIKNRLFGPKIVFWTKYHQKDDICCKKWYLVQKMIFDPKNDICSRNDIWSNKTIFAPKPFGIKYRRFGPKIVFWTKYPLFGPNIVFLDQKSSFRTKDLFCTKYHQKDDNCSKRRYLAQKRS